MIKYLSWDTKSTVPSYVLSASSKVSFVEISMWFVGSSKIIKLQWSCIKANNFNLTFSPPDNLDIFLNTFSP